MGCAGATPRRSSTLLIPVFGPNGKARRRAGGAQALRRSIRELLRTCRGCAIRGICHSPKSWTGCLRIAGLLFRLIRHAERGILLIVKQFVVRQKGARCRSDDQIALVGPRRRCGCEQWSKTSAQTNREIATAAGGAHQRSHRERKRISSEVSLRRGHLLQLAEILRR